MQHKEWTPIRFFMPHSFSRIVFFYSQSVLLGGAEPTTAVRAAVLCAVVFDQVVVDPGGAEPAVAVRVDISLTAVFDRVVRDLGGAEPTTAAHAATPSTGVSD